MKLIDLFKDEYVGREIKDRSGRIRILNRTNIGNFCMYASINDIFMDMFCSNELFSDDWELIEEPLPEIKPCWSCNKPPLKTTGHSVSINCKGIFPDCKNCAISWGSSGRQAILMWNAMYEVAKNETN